MPIGPVEREVLRLLAVNRHPDSYVGGATVVHQAADSPRRSQDIDLFHDAADSLRRAVEQDQATLESAGFTVQFAIRQANYYRAAAARGDSATKLEWLLDSAFRFFPVEADPDFGWRLNFWDAATNKVLAFAGRSTLRDYVDVIFLHERHLSFGALSWAAAGKDPGLTPELIIEFARRNARFPAEDLAKLDLTRPLDFQNLKRIFLQAALDAESLFTRLPPTEMGCFYLNSDGAPVCPDPNDPDFSSLVRHFGSVKGAWPRIAEE